MKKILAFIFIVATLTGYIQLFAQTTNIPLSKETTTINNKTFYVHIVKKGQTLYSISKAYNVTVKEIAENNSNILQNIATDVKILIPKHETNIDYGYHYVTKGETLYSISKLYNHTPGELLNLNPGLTTTLTLGQRIRYQRSGEVAPTQTNNTTNNQENTKSQKIHCVEKGETVYSISKTYNVPVDVLKQTNPDIADGLQIGQKIIIPTGTNEYKPKIYFYHIIQKSETLFAIAQQYKTDVTSLAYLNPFAKEGIKEGMVLKIEITRFNKNIQEQQHPSDIIFHEVVQGETAYSIADQYNVPFKKIKKQNTEIDLEALPLGIILKIPVSDNSIAEYNVNNTKIIVEKDSIVVARKCKCDSISTDTARTIKIALMLPFLLPENDSIKYDGKVIHQTEKVYPKSIPFIEFYQGALMALDTLKQYGYNVHVTVFDTELDTNKVKSDLISINKSNTDLIIGPVYYQTFATAQRFAKAKQIPIVSPLAAKNYGLDSNPYIIAANTSNENRIATSALYLSQYVDQNFVVVHNGYITEFEMMNEYKKALSISAHDSIYFNNIIFKVVNFSESGIAGVEDALNSKSQNFIIIPSNDQGYVSDVVTKLFQFKDKYKIKLFGLSNWETFDNLELEYLYKLNLHIPISNNIDYTQPIIKDFIKNYRNKYATEPSKFSFQGYDVMLYFSNAVAKYPDRLLDCLPELKSEGLQIKYDFRQLGKNMGIENNGAYLLEYQPEYTRHIIDFEQSEIEIQKNDKIKDMYKFNNVDQTQPNTSKSLYFK